MMLITRGNHELSWRLWRPKQDRRRRTTPLSPTNFDIPYVRESKHTLHDVGNDQWLDLFRLFSAVTNLYLSKGPATCVAPALQKLVGKEATELLPALRNRLIRNFLSSELV